MFDALAVGSLVCTVRRACNRVGVSTRAHAPAYIGVHIRMYVAPVCVCVCMCKAFSTSRTYTRVSTGEVVHRLRAEARYYLVSSNTGYSLSLSLLLLSIFHSPSLSRYVRAADAK